MDRILFVMDKGNEELLMETDEVETVDIREHVEMGLRYGIRTIPTLIEDNGNNSVKKIVGIQPIKKYLEKIEK